MTSDYSYSALNATNLTSVSSQRTHDTYPQENQLHQQDDGNDRQTKLTEQRRIANKWSKRRSRARQKARVTCMEMEVEMMNFVRHTFEALPEPTVAILRSGQIVFVSKAFESAFGYKEEELLQKKLNEFVCPESKDEFNTIIESNWQYQSSDGSSEDPVTLTITDALESDESISNSYSNSHDSDGSNTRSNETQQDTSSNGQKSSEANFKEYSINDTDSSSQLDLKSHCPTNSQSNGSSRGYMHSTLDDGKNKTNDQEIDTSNSSSNLSNTEIKEKQEEVQSEERNEKKDTFNDLDSQDDIQSNSNSNESSTNSCYLQTKSEESYSTNDIQSHNIWMSTKNGFKVSCTLSCSKVWLDKEYSDTGEQFGNQLRTELQDEMVVVLKIKETNSDLAHPYLYQPKFDLDNFEENYNGQKRRRIC